MKLEAEQKEFLLRGLSMMSERVPLPYAVKIRKLFEQIEPGDVHVMPKDHLEKLIRNIHELQRLNDEARKTMRLYIDTVQKRCGHRFHKPDPKNYRGYVKTDSCQICGYVVTPPADKLRLMDDA